jgi:hypothetical protein
MANFKEIVKQAQKLVIDSELKDVLLPLWRLIEWQGHTENSTGIGAELSRNGGAVIHLYPSLRHPIQALREFGTFVLARTGERGTALWKNKLDIPTKEHIGMAKSKLECPELRQTCRDYKSVLDDYPDKGHSVDRLVYINVINALLANNISYQDSQGVDIMTWGPTAEYCHLRKYHCLIPLASAYCPANIYNDFGTAMASMVIGKLGEVRDSSVAFAMRGMVQRIGKIANPG